ncbi:Eco57I restriction-modification methylase domain-containing protein [Sphingobacterium sp. WOUb80]|uniref:Eco57I restriction-modification methylase domain-containing protein n=1 Tax=Sphingobacterium sp. WOUb80 TaxID=3234028 RepID=UPI003CF118FD
MIHFLHNIGDFFASNYFDENFGKKVIEKSGYSTDATKDINKKINQLKPEYFKLKQRFIENHLRVKDKINLSHDFHSKVLRALGYDAENTQYHELFPINDKSVLPIRHILYRGDRPHLMVMEMHAMIKTKDEEEPDGLFEQSYTSLHDGDEKTTKEQKYHRSQWADIFSVSEEVSISPMIINQAVNELFLLPEKRRPHYVLLCAGNQYFLLEAEKWFRGSYLQLDLEALFDDVAITKDYYSIFYLLLGKDLLAPTAEMVLMDQLDEDSHKAAYEVTKDLKEGVIHAVESLANEAVRDLELQGVQPADIDASKLKDDCLNMVYRLLFLFYAESREDLDILPSNDEVYERGYSLEMLRDLEQVPLITESSLNGYFFHQSLFQLFDLLNKGYHENEGSNKSFKIRHLDSPMFDNSLLHYLNRVKIRNQVWQDVICELSLSKKQNKKSRGRISYANLGINQLGSVYESLLAFRGFLAETDYIEVHRKRKSNESSEKVVSIDGSYLVPRHRLDDFDPKEVYYTEKADGDQELKVIPKGTFIYRLSGRDRQKSASYFTPEVLTQTTVKYTLKPILERLDKGEIQALDLLQLKILEPAMGAAAFHNEVINQLAQAYLTYRQQEKKQQVDPNKYQEELQKIKAYIALNNVYGVDLNPTAIELGKLSLWLNVIHKEMQTPFFGYRLGVGNAVVGSWLKVFKHKDFSFEPIGKVGNKFVKKEWWTQAPKHLKFGKKGILRREDEIYHFLLPDAGMASSGGIKLLKEAFPERAARINEWRRDFCKPLRNDEFIRVQRIAKAVDTLLLAHYDIQKNISLITENNPQYFGNPNTVMQLDFQSYSFEQKQTFAQERLKPNAPYYKLKQLMDYWCSLWFWDVRDAEHLPTRAEWYDDLEQLLNIDLAAASLGQQPENETVRDYRKDKKQLEKELANALKQSTTSLFTNERADLVQHYAEQYKFFHYELEFIEVFREQNGFDIAVGNPPWISVSFDETGVVSEYYPEVFVKNFSAPKVKTFAEKHLDENAALAEIYLNESFEAHTTKEFLGAVQNYPLLVGQRNNLYKCVLENGLHWINEVGYLGLIHPEGVYDDPDGYALRKEIYQRLKYHFQFQNAFNLFAEVAHREKYGIHIYAGEKGEVGFYSINNIFHPAIIDGCFTHRKTTELVEGLKIKDENSQSFVWNVKSHPSRKVWIDQHVLKILAQTFENTKNWEGTKLVSIHAKEIIGIIKKIGLTLRSLKTSEQIISTCWNETNEISTNKISRITKYPKIENFEMVYSGPHFFVGNPMYKTPRSISKEKADYDIIDFTQIDENYTARTNYVPQNITAGYRNSIVGFQKEDGTYDNWLDYYKIAFREMISSASERTVNGAILLPYSGHINTVISVIFKDITDLIEFSGLVNSISIDFIIKTIASPHLNKSRLEQLPLGIADKYKPALFVRTLQLNCLNKYYSPLWKESFQDAFMQETWSIDDERLKPFSSLTEAWTWDTPLRNYFERRLALVEIDVITAMALNLTLEELILMYNIQFPVLQQNEDDTWYDTKGNIVFTCSKGLVGVGLDRPEWNAIKDMQAGETYEHIITKSELYQGEKIIYHAPFTKQDRVEDYKRAWAHFEEKFK